MFNVRVTWLDGLTAWGCLSVLLLGLMAVRSRSSEPTNSSPSAPSIQLESTEAEPVCELAGLSCDQPLDVCGVYGRIYNYDPTVPLCYACGDGFCVPHECWCGPVGDLNCDGVVNLLDFKIMQAAFGEVR